MSSWIKYVATIAQGSSPQASAAKLCKQLKGAYPSKALKNVDNDLTDGVIDAESYRIRVEAIEIVRDMKERGVQTHRIFTHAGDWTPLGNNAHMRVTHIAQVGGEA